MTNARDDGQFSLINRRQRRAAASVGDNTSKFTIYIYGRLVLVSYVVASQAESERSPKASRIFNLIRKREMHIELSTSRSRQSLIASISNARYGPEQ